MTNTHALGSFTPPATRLIIMFFLRGYLRWITKVSPFLWGSSAHLRRKALHLPTQSFATAHAKHCKCQRKALQVPTQSIACANAKHCMCQRKALHPPTHSFSWSFGLMTSPCFSIESLLAMFFCENFLVSPPLWLYLQYVSWRKAINSRAGKVIVT